MTKNVVVDDALVAEAMTLGGHKTKREAATAALESYIKARLPAGVVDMIRKADCHPAYKRKAARRRRKK